MSSIIKSGNAQHDQNCLIALGTLLGGLSGVTTQAAVNAQYVTFYRTLRSSAIANACGHEPFDTALRALYTGGA